MISRLVAALLVAIPSILSLSTTTSAKTGKSAWKPQIASLEERRRLRGIKHDSENIGSLGFHHVEFYCGDAKSMAHRFSLALGMPCVGETGQHTGNDQCTSYGLVSGDFRLLMTAPYSQAMASLGGKPSPQDEAPNPLPSFSAAEAHAFFQKHGLAARAIGLEVRDAQAAFEKSVANGATPVLEPTIVPTCRGQQKKGATLTGCKIAEVQLYDDVVLRYVSYPEGTDRDPNMPFLPHLAPSEGTMSKRPTFGIRRIDHAVGNVPDLLEAHNRIKAFTGFHEFAEFTAEDVGTVDSGLNSVVLASDSEQVLLPLNEPTPGKRKSQIQTYLEQNEGAGLQHLALKTDDIFATIRQMREAEEMFGGFELMKRPSDEYYRDLPDRLGDQLTEEQYASLEVLGILADADDEGILLQVFTKPIGDRPTFFVEIIQRIGCLDRPDEESEEVLERPGCGGFGQGNFRELFKAIEDHEKTLKV
jgi:4-hydroxyphenylpyruvate dioxygenase